MDSNLEEIRQRVETYEDFLKNPAYYKNSAPRTQLERYAYTDLAYLLSEIDRLNALHKREIIVTGEYAQRVIDLTARAEAAEAERDAAVEDMTAVLKRDSDDICAYCKNRIECKNEQCEKYSSGVGDVDGKLS